MIGEIKMDKMNLFGDYNKSNEAALDLNGESSETLSGDNNKENSKPKATTGMFANCDPLPAEMRENFKFTDEEINYLRGVGKMFKDPKLVDPKIIEDILEGSDPENK